MSSNDGFGANSTAEEVLRGHDLSGVHALITGASSGIGIETARTLALSGAEVILAVRNVAAGEDVADTILAETGRRPRVEELDLGSQKSVRALVSRLTGVPLNLLIANAGVMATPQERTEDGFEMQLGTNHFGHFALIVGLTPNLVASAPSRVVVLSSAAHTLGGMDFHDLHFERRAYDKWKSYAQSKTANALFALEYDRRMAPQGVSAWSVMPGRIRTGLMRHITEADLVAMKPVAGSPPPKSISEGAATSVWAATARELEGQGGRYLEDCAIAKRWSPEVGVRVGVADHATDPEAARRLWAVSQGATGVSLP